MNPMGTLYMTKREVDFVPKTRPNFLKNVFKKFGRVLGTKSTSNHWPLGCPYLKNIVI